MKRQVLVIHGGTTFDTHEDYLQYLENATIDIERIKPGFDWKQTLHAELGDTFEVLTPKMPNSTNAQYKEWKIWFENILTVVNKEIILIGHSLGGIFLAKYLSEHLIDSDIEKLILIAAPYTDTPDESLASFKLKNNLSKVSDQAKKIYLLHSKDDPVVPYSDVLEYQKQLPNTEVIIFKDRQHFNQENFPELAKIIEKSFT